MDSRYQPSFVYLIVSLILCAVKFIAYSLTLSDAIFSDAMESLVNIVAATLSFYALYKSHQKNSQFPYGAGKLESISTFAEGGLLAFASLAIVFEAFTSLVNKQSLQDLQVGIYLIFLTSIGNALLAFYLSKQAKKLKSQALKASASHIFSDVMTSLSLIAGLFLIQWTGWMFLDSVIAFGLAFFIAYLSFKHLKIGIREILDKEDPKLLQKLEKVLSNIEQPGIIQIHQVKIIRSGPLHHIDAHFVIPEFWDVKAIHHELEKLEQSISKQYDYQVEIGSHLDPCRQAYCKHCKVQPCSIRKENFVEKLQVSVDQMRSPVEPKPFRKS